MKNCNWKPPLIAAVTIVATMTACKPAQPPTDRADKSGPSQITQQRLQKGETLYKQFCSSCHPDGGNVTDPENNLRRATLKAKKINKPEDIVSIMRKPVSRMLSFDTATISDDDAKSIAEYILATF